jgi:hypothetical protein
MKTLDQAKAGGAFCRLIFPLVLVFALARTLHAAGLLPPGNYPPDAIASWSFEDTNNWTSDQGDSPISFTNISWALLGDGSSLVVNSNAPAWLNFNVIDPTNSQTNLVLNAPGSITFWFGPGWSSGTNGGGGPGQWSELVSVGEWTTNASFGYFGLSVDAAGSNVWFSSQDGLGDTYSLFAPIVSWTTNYFHSLTLTYSSTNVSIYMDGRLATNDPGGLSIWPSPAAVSSGIWFGSDTNGEQQAQGMFNSIATYNTVLDSNTVQEIYSSQLTYYELSPWNIPYMDALSSGGSNPSTYDFTNSTLPDVITGSGLLQSDGMMPNWTANANPYYVWITNVVATQTGGGTMSMTFSINGGQSGYLYDVFATSALQIPLSSGVWYWWGQGDAGYTYTVTVTNASEVLLVLGTPLSTTGNGLTDAYELLILHNSDTNYSTDGTGMADGWEVLYFGHTGVSPTGDPDGDGLSTFQEWLMRSEGYNPINWNSFTNSPIGDGYQNYSGDGLANLLQADFGGNMLTNNPTWKENISGDGLSDEYKTMIGLTPSTPTSVLGLPSYSMNPVQ